MQPNGLDRVGNFQLQNKTWAKDIPIALKKKKMKEVSQHTNALIVSVELF